MEEIDDDTAPPDCDPPTRDVVLERDVAPAQELVDRGGDPLPVMDPELPTRDVLERDVSLAQELVDYGEDPLPVVQQGDEDDLATSEEECARRGQK